jgi:hypothetical protein
MASDYPDYAMRWPDGSAINPELRDMLRPGLDSGFEIQHAEFAWNADESLAVTIRLAVTRGRGRSEIWELSLSYSPDEATALRDEATPAQREWFTMMLRTHLTEWWATRTAVVVTAARQVKDERSSHRERRPDGS